MAHSWPTYRLFRRATVWSIEELERLAAVVPWWVFRGHSCLDFRLQPSIERSHDAANWLTIEGEGVDDLRRSWRSPYAPPEESDHLAWLGLLRHAGKPVRLLDFTRRLPVAVFFATAEPSTDLPCVWAVDGTRLNLAWKNPITPRTETLYIGSPFANWKEFNRIYPSQPELGHAAMMVEPRFPNRRQQLQEGLFLAALNMGYTLEENVFGAFKRNGTDVVPDRNPRGMLTGPIVTNLHPLDAKGLEAMKVPLLQIVLRVPKEEIRAYLERENVSAQTLGLEDDP